MNNRHIEAAAKAKKAITESNGTNVPHFNNAIKELAEAIALISLDIGEIKSYLNQIKK